MDPFDELLIKKYFTLDEKTKKLHWYKKQLTEIFYSQNMATHLVYDAHGVHAVGFRQDRKVPDYLESLDMVDERIERIRLRKKYFSHYLDTLSNLDRNDLENNLSIVSEKLIVNTLDEIDQIEISMCLREGIEVEEGFSRIALTENFEENINLLSDLFAI